jgi:tetratricopeptide (TPR) repeat protein
VIPDPDDSVTDSMHKTIASQPGPGTARAIVLISIVALFAYFNSLHGDFVLDDYQFYSDPQIDHPLKSLMAARPVIALSLALNHRVDGLNTRGYHALNLAVHALAAFFLYALVRRTLLMPRFEGRFDEWAGWIGLACALVWMVHPLQTQSVTYVIQRCESFMGMFFLASLWCYVRGATAERGLWWYVAAVFCCALGAGCKEMMPMLVPIALLYDRTFLTGSWRESIRKRWAVLAGISVPPAAGILALFFSGLFTNPDSTVGFGVKLHTPYSYALTQSEVIIHYLRLAVYPVGQVLDYVDWKPRTTLAECWLTLSAILGLLTITAIGVWKRCAWSFPAAWFFIILAPSSSIVPVQDVAFEHRMYLPLAGIVVLIVCGIAWAALKVSSFVRQSSIPGVVLGIVACATIFTLGTMTAARNEDYSSAARLYADNVDKRPGNGRARLNLALHLLAGGDTVGAETQLNEALRLPLQMPNLQTQQVRVLRESGRTAEAIQLGQLLLAAKPNSDDDALELGLSLLADGRVAESLPLLKRATEKFPTKKFTHLNYGVALEQTGHLDEAMIEYRAARDLDPEFAVQSIRAARRIADDPDAKPSHLRMALYFASAACRMSDSLTVEFPDTYAIALARMGKFTEAIQESTKAAAMAREKGDKYLESRIDARTASYRARKPFLPETIAHQP